MQKFSVDRDRRVVVTPGGGLESLSEILRLQRKNRRYGLAG